MSKNFKNVISVLLAVLLVITSAVCGVAVNDAADESTTIVENTEATEENTTEAPSEEETTTEAPSEEETTTEAPSEEETTTESPSEEETTEAPSEEETTTEAPSEEETTTEAPSEEVTTTEAPSEEETTTEAPSEVETTTEPSEPEEPTTEAPSEEETTTETPSEEETTTEAPSEEEPTTDPTEPSDPEEPSTDPTEPSDPEEPSTDPTEPSDPEEPSTDPTEPSDPEEPSTDPTEPSDPEEPSTDPTEPSDPEEPSTDPTEPSEPEEPTTDPTEPSDPEEPTTDPTEPSDPEEPTTDPTEPSYPTEPSEPEEPSEPDEPEVPETVIPENVDITLTSGRKGVVISWADAFGFLGEDYAYGTGYRIYRKTVDSNWKRIATVADVLEYTDTSAVYGETYYYVIRAFYNTAEGETIIGSYNEAGFEIAPKYVITPEITEVSFQKNRYVKIVWTNIPGATKYALYRSTAPDGKFTKIYVGTVRKFADKTATAGETYYYKVKAYTDTKGSAASELAAYTYKVAAPTIKSNLTVNETSIKLVWSKVKGADGYKIYRKVNNNDEWKLIKTVKSGDTTSYVNKGLDGTYIYAIRGYHKEGTKTVNGTLSEPVRVRTLAKVKTVKVTTDKNTYTNTVKWSKVKGAAGYQLYAKISGGEWEHITTTSNSERSYSHQVTENTTYYYKIRAIFASGVTSFTEKSIKVTILPDYTVTLPSKDSIDYSYIQVKVKNNSKEKMYIFNEGSTYFYDENTFTLNLSKSTKRNFVDFIEVPAGKSVTFYMHYPETFSPKYYTDAFVGFLLRHGDKLFVTASSYKYGTQSIYYGTF